MGEKPQKKRKYNGDRWRLWVKTPLEKPPHGLGVLALLPESPASLEFGVEVPRSPYTGNYTVKVYLKIPILPCSKGLVLLLRRTALSSQGPQLVIIRILPCFLTCFHRTPNETANKEKDSGLVIAAPVSKAPYQHT